MSHLKPYMQQVLTLVWKDIAVERRTKEIFPQMAAFSVLIIVIFQVAIPLGTPMQDLLPGLLWIALTFAGILGLNHTFFVERENECLQGLRLCPMARSGIYLGKIIGIFLMMSAMECVLFPVLLVLFNVTPGMYLFRLGMVAILGTLGFAAIGTIFAAMSANTRIREVLLPLLVFPVMIPLLILAVNVTEKIFAQKPWAAMASEISVLCVFDAMFLGLSMLMFEYILDSE